MQSPRVGRLGAAIAAGLILAACGATPAASPTSSPIVASASASALPTPSGTPVVQPTGSRAASEAPLPTGPALAYPRELDFVNEFAMRVTVTELNVRATPSATGKKFGTARKGAMFLVKNWPIRADGYTWYFGYQVVLPADGSIPQLPDPITAGVDPLAGWLAAGTSANAYALPIAPRCPTVPDLRNISAMLDSEVLTCIGSSSITLEGTFGCGGCGGTNVGTFTPEWLANPGNFDFLSVNPEDVVGPLALYVPPSVPPLPAEGSILRVQGHFADPLAKACAIAVPPLGNPDGVLAPIDPSAAFAYCRTRFVVEYFEILGADPSFPLA